MRLATVTSQARRCSEVRDTNLVVANDIQQSDDVGSATEVLQDLDLALYLFLLDGLEDLDDTFLVVDDVDALKDLGVFASAWQESISRRY